MELTPFFIGLYKFVKHGLYPLTWVVLLVTSSLLLMTLSSPLVATPLVDSLESHPPQLTPSDRFDVIVVLGGGIDERGSLRLTNETSAYSRNRTTCGVDL